VEIKQVGETQTVIDVISHYIKKTVKESLPIVNAIPPMNKSGPRKKLRLANTFDKNFVF
jgi:hypothetical protein